MLPILKLHLQFALLILDSYMEFNDLRFGCNLYFNMKRQLLRLKSKCETLNFVLVNIVFQCNLQWIHLTWSAFEIRRLMHTLLQRTLYSKETLCIVTSCSNGVKGSEWQRVIRSKVCWGVNCDFAKCGGLPSVLSSWEAKCVFWVKCSLKQSVR